MQRLLLFLVLSSALYTEAQNFTGTWLAAYYRDLPANKRLFYYRLHLVQKNDSIYGICEALDAQTDIKGTRPADAVVMARYKVSHIVTDAERDSPHFHLTVNGSAEGLIENTGEMPPSFLEFECNVMRDETELLQPQIIYSLVPAADGPTGKLSVFKIAGATFPVDNYKESFRLRWNKRSVQRNTATIKYNSETNGIATTLLKQAALRKDSVQSIIEVTATRAQIELFDNGIVDDDTVSLFLNGKILVDQKRLAATALQLQVDLDPVKENVFTLFAHNMGAVPPNSAMLIINLDDHRYQLSLSSTLDKNGVLIIRVKRKGAT